MDYKWVMKDVSELKEESFTSTLENHVAAIEFQLSEFRQPLNPRQFMRTWPDLVKELMEDEDFGKSLTSANNWLSDEMKVILVGASTEADKAQKIFTFLRDNITCTDYQALYT